jgi:hypothetical protein
MTERLDRIEALQEQAQIEMAALRELTRQSREDISDLRKLIDSNAKAIQSQGNQSAADRDLSRQSREETREDIRELVTLIREDRERSLIQEREIRMQSGEIQNLADSIQQLYSRQPPPTS